MTKAVYNENIVDAILIVLKLAEKDLTIPELTGRIQSMIVDSTSYQIKEHILPLIDARIITMNSKFKLRYADG